MNPIYLDTNIFIYLADSTSPKQQACQDLINFLIDQKYPIATSAETIQEIIHYSINTKQLDAGLEIANKTLEIVSMLYPLSHETIKLYLDNAKIYRNSDSRDLIHVSSCQEFKINQLITYDKGYQKFKEISSHTPSEFLRAPRV